MPPQPINGGRNLPPARSATGIFALAALLLSLTFWVVTIDPALTLFSPGGLIMRNAAPAILGALAAWAGFRRLGIAIVFGAGLVWLLHLANEIKLQNMGMPLLPTDATMAGQVLSNPGLFLPYLPMRLIGTVGLACLTLFALSLRFEPPTFPPSPSLRALVAVAGAVLLASAFAGNTPMRQAYVGQFEQGPDVLPWNPGAFYAQAGLFNGIAFYAAQARDAVGTPDLARIEAFSADHASDLTRLQGMPKTKGRPPDIIVIQVEALFDPGRIVGLDADPWMSHWYAHARRGIHGTLESPSYGGKTIRAEFEAMTGYTLNAFPTVEYPYYGLLVDDLPTLPNHLADLGYATRAIHPFKASFWNREVAMRALGFQTLAFEDEFQNALRAGPYISDQALYGRLREEADRPAALQRADFVLAITMENHGPWTGNFRQMLDDDLPALPEALGGLPGTTQVELRRYLWHVRNGDRSLGEALDALLARDEPLLVVVYGDHLPALHAVFEKVEFDDGRGPREQPVPFVIVSNTGLSPRRFEHPLPMSSLPSLVLEAAGLPQPGHFGIESVLRNLPSDHPDRRSAKALRRDLAWQDFAAPTAPDDTRSAPPPGR